MKKSFWKSKITGCYVDSVTFERTKIFFSSHRFSSVSECISWNINTFKVFTQLKQNVGIQLWLFFWTHFSSLTFFQQDTRWRKLYIMILADQLVNKVLFQFLIQILNTCLRTFLVNDSCGTEDPLCFWDLYNNVEHFAAGWVSHFETKTQKDLSAILWKMDNWWGRGVHWEA